MHATPLITTLVGALVTAFLLGAVALKLRLPPLLGYLAAGILIGPFTPGFVADGHLAAELAELGVILLMFGVGLHFSIQDLWAVRRIALPGAFAQITVAIALGCGLSVLLGWSVPQGLLFGMALSVASTVVLLKALEEHNKLETPAGKVAVGWLVSEDLATILALVLIPALAGSAAANLGDSLQAILLTLGKVAAFVAVMMLVGQKVIPWMLEKIVHTGSREMFRLGVLATALGVAYGATALFEVSFALGAFFAGTVLAGSPFSHRAAEEAMPLRDAFSVLFFVAAGMLFDPRVLMTDTAAVLATLAIIIVGKGLAAWLLMALLRQPRGERWLLAASLAQIGEFSFILANLGLSLQLLPERGHALIMAGAILSILLNPLLFRLALRRAGPPAAATGAM
ncbi:cation:proton antiporter domain-containing protein [Vogesella mureinivorans]|uniref:cation:proton antiporter domain-containing protein n=1 Tax=Vogesella mureinivorans TaxID=657276 RepID=UPI0011C741CA|nr:cation:proton antiporter [Vogesella mureinivorans]